MIEYFSAALMLVGATFILISSFGLLRFKTLNNKIQASGITSSFGLPVMIIGLWIFHPPAGGFCFALLLCNILVSPLSSHLLAKAGISQKKIKLAEGSHQEDHHE